MRPLTTRPGSASGSNCAAFLICGECGCASDEYTDRWAAFMGEDPDGRDSTSVVIMCPVCATREFEWRPEAAEVYT